VKSANCPWCGRFTRRTKEGLLFRHIDVTSGEVCDGTGELVPEPGPRTPNRDRLTAPSEIDKPDGQEVMSQLEYAAEQAVRQVERAWRFIWQQDPPDNLGPSIRAQVLAGANATLIVGAVTIAAQRRNLDYDSQWVYACGIVRNSLAARHMEEF
jgi:hypothetical protein